MVELVAFAVFVWIYRGDYRNEPSTIASSWFSDPEALSPIFGASFGMAALFGAALEVGLTMVLLVPMVRDWLIERERQKIEGLAQTIQQQDQTIEDREQTIEDLDQTIEDQNRVIEGLRQENEILRQERLSNGNSPDSG